MATVNIEDKLYEEIREYCRLNKLTISVFVNDLLRKNFMVEKYDDAPPFFKKKNIESVVVTGTLTKEGEFEQEKAEVKEVMERGQTVEEFQQRYQADPEPIKKEEEKPEVVTEEKPKEKELTPKEKARQRVQYL